MKRSLSAIGLSAVLVVAIAGIGDSAEKKGTTPTYKPPKKVIVQALTDAECKNLGCKVFLDSGCKTDFGDNGSHTGHKCVCSSGSSCIDTAK
jgi:hypothetical protein